MPAIIALNEVETNDAQPTDAPYRISDKTDHDTATVRFTLDAPDPLVPSKDLTPRTTLPPRHTKFRAYRLRVDDVDIGGADMDIDPGTEVEAEVTYQDIGSPPDGQVTVTVWAWHDAYGWI